MGASPAAPGVARERWPSPLISACTPLPPVPAEPAGCLVLGAGVRVGGGWRAQPVGHSLGRSENPLVSLPRTPQALLWFTGCAVGIRTVRRGVPLAAPLPPSISPFTVALPVSWLPWAPALSLLPRGLQQALVSINILLLFPCPSPATCLPSQKALGLPGGEGQPGPASSPSVAAKWTGVGRTLSPFVLGSGGGQ